MDEFREIFLDYMEECELCGCYHRLDFNGDCREDLERF